jgi:hypothetical protein
MVERGGDADSVNGRRRLAVEYELGENNAPRGCQHGECDEEADFYMLEFDEVSKYVCGDHREWAARQVTGISGEDESASRGDSFWEQQ